MATLQGERGHFGATQDSQRRNRADPAADIHQHVPYAVKSGREFALVTRRDDHRPEKGKANLSAVRVPAKQQVDAVAAKEVDDVGMMADRDARRGRIDIPKRAIDIRITAIDFVDPDQRQGQLEGFIDQKSYAARGHRGHNLIRTRPIVMVPEDGEDAIASTEI